MSLSWLPRISNDSDVEDVLLLLAAASDVTLTGAHEVPLKKPSCIYSQYPRSKNTLQSKSYDCMEKDGAWHAGCVQTVQYHSALQVGTSPSSISGSGEFYKMYYYDVMPVRDDTMTSETTSDSGKGEGITVTDSHLDEVKKNVSQDIKTDSSYNTFDSSIKFFKVTVEEIFRNFYNNMQDFELYKKKFHELLTKDQENCAEEMEDFIKDMIHHIMSSESADFNANCLCDRKNKAVLEESASAVDSIKHLQCIMQSFENKNYCNESTSDEIDVGSKQESKDIVKGSEILNTFLLSKNPYVKLKVDENKNRLNFSEIQITDKGTDQELKKRAASADNINKHASKSLELDMLEPTNTCDYTDRVLPVKFSFAKKNIHSEDDGHREENHTEKSFLTKFCSYLCKKIRKAVNMGM